MAHRLEGKTRCPYWGATAITVADAKHCSAESAHVFVTERCEAEFTKAVPAKSVLCKSPVPVLDRGRHRRSVLYSGLARHSAGVK